jgi:hypothetical protein
MSDPTRDPRDTLDEALASLPRDIQPSRDLWQGIHAEIAKTPIVTDKAPVVSFFSTRLFQVAAGVVLMLATSLTTYVITRQSMQESAAPQIANEVVPAPALNVMPVAFGSEALGAGYLKARSDLDKRFEERLATLPPATRAKLQRSLADLRRAANEISTTLAEHPSDPLLQDLLMSTYQRELQLLADVSDVPTSALATEVRTDL